MRNQWFLEEFVGAGAFAPHQLRPLQNFDIVCLNPGNLRNLVPGLGHEEAFEEEQGTQTLVTVGGLHAEHAEAVGLDFLKLQPEGHLQKSEDALAAAGCMKDLIHIWQREGKPYFTPIGTDE